MKLEGRSSIVTGGAGGLGSATVRRLVEVGMGVTVFDRDTNRAEELAKELGDAATAVGGDVNDDDDVAAQLTRRARRASYPWSSTSPVAASGVDVRSGATARRTTRPRSSGRWR